MFELFTSILAITLGAGTSLIYATLGEIYTERSGILNLGVEGIMLMGALTAFASAFYSGSLVIALIAAMATGAVLAGMHAFLCITMRANQVVSGLCITLFGSGLASFLGQTLGPQSNSRYLVGLSGPKFTPVAIPGLHSVPILGAVFNQDILTYMVYLLVMVAWFYLYRTKSGLNLRAAGENPQTADAMGIPVSKVRYAATIWGGMLIGLAAHISPWRIRRVGPRTSRADAGGSSLPW